MFLKTMIGGAAAVLIAVPAFAQQEQQGQQDQQKRQQPSPYIRANNTWITIDGTVDSVMRDAFVLDYGPRTIKVEMDDSDRRSEGYLLRKGDKVRVNGVVDADLFETRTIEASSVFVENLGTMFYASAADEEDWGLIWNWPVSVTSASVTGRVTEIGDDEFVVGTGDRRIEVSVEEMSYNPLDTVGYQQIRVGDLVTVYGEMDTELFDDTREFDARSVVTLRQP